MFLLYGDTSLKLIKIISIFVVGSLFVSGCSSVNTLSTSKGQGTIKNYRIDRDKIWPAVKKAITMTGGTVTEVNEEDYCVLGEYDQTYTSWGTFVAIFAEPNFTGGTSVEVIIKPKLATNVCHGQKPTPIFQYIGQQANIIRDKESQVEK